MKIPRSRDAGLRAGLTTTLLLPLLLMALTISGCGGGSGDGGGGSADKGDKAIKAREKALASQEEAIEEGCEKYAPDRYARAIKSLAKAQGYHDDGDFSRSSKLFRNAKSLFERASKAAPKAKKTYDLADKARTKYTTKLAAAKEKKYHEVFTEDYESALETAEKAEEYFAESKFKQAKSRFAAATRDIESMFETAKLSSAAQAKAAKAKSEMAAMKKRALEAGAEKTQISDWELAKDQESEAETHWMESHYLDAEYSYRGAKEWYAIALEKVREREVAANIDASGSSGSNGADSREPAPDIDDLDIPDLDGDLDGDGPIDIVSDIDRLFHTDVDYRDGILRLEYPFGVDFKRDVKFVTPMSRGPAVKRTIHFEGGIGVGMGFSGSPDEDEEDEVDPEDILSYTFAANTEGLLLLEAGFKDGVNLEFDVRFQLVLAKCLFRTFVNSNRKGNSYMGTDWGARFVVAQDRKALKAEPHKDKLYRKAPQLWVKKTEDYHYKLIYRKDSEDETGVFRIFLNDEEMFRKKIDKYRKGYVGFRWKNTKFIVKDLRVSGRLDEEWAMKKLEGLADTPDETDDDDLDF